MGNLLPGTKLDANKIKILSAYILTKGGKEAYIVILTDSGSDVYPYTPELEKSLSSLVGNLSTHEIDIHEVIKFFHENSAVINLLNLLSSKANKFNP